MAIAYEMACFGFLDTYGNAHMFHATENFE